MPKMTADLSALPGSPKPLWTSAQLQAYYGVSDWQVRKWRKAGMPTVPVALTSPRFDIDAVKAWMAANAPADDDAESPQLAAVGA
ncbi:hypothetical protein [Streptomyces xantholiticus]|uniref:hypothetical protein n=1 Tax=Streptomyces xantholiticus TaxID=68285 RepID=UPI00167A5C48|nr:hypothetical protein [Streptomyces xantholiticus]GGW41064.1 hypothetical protein GCM10010381_27360 [Streptomyces xantholiticus]